MEEEQKEVEAKQEFINPIVELMLLLKSVQEARQNKKLNKISTKDAFGRRIYF